MHVFFSGPPLNAMFGNNPGENKIPQVIWQTLSAEFI